MNTMTVLLPSGKPVGPSVSIDAWEPWELIDFVHRSLELDRTVIINGYVYTSAAQIRFA
jgi:hypothetical protein